MTDQGSGIPESVLPTIFDPFVTTKDAGTGLGLANVRDIVEGLGGSVRVQTQVGVGSTFTVSLPVTDAPAERTTTVGEQEASGLQHAQVLVVEDDIRVRASIVSGLEQVGASAHEARSADDAIRQLEGGLHPDLICTDAVMPGGGGEQVLAWVEAHSPCTPLLLISGYSPSAALWEAVAAGRVHLLVKPFTRCDLLEALETARSAPQPQEEQANR